MDGSPNGAGNGVTAVVVRQFTSCRIERQLLAQVFELMCSERRPVESTHSATPRGASTARWDHGDQSTETLRGRRHAV
jgi:hypothetical protein